ncbi:MAG: DNA polymerase III subunit delta' [Anaerolineae bacterium]
MWHTVGHDWAIDLLQHALNNGRLAHAFLLVGPEEIGKSTLATEMAAALNCTGTLAPCRVCPACRKSLAGIHPDVTRIEPQNGRIKIDQIRQLQRQVSLSPYEGRTRVCLITDLHLATTEAANALLKTLEEPPPRVILVLSATDIGLLLPTVVSRCQVLALRPVATEVIIRLLCDQEKCSREQATMIARWAAGRIGWALHAARDPGLLSARQQHMDNLVTLLNQKRLERLRMVETLSRRDNLHEILQLWQVWWRDVVLVASDCADLITNSDRLETLHLLAQSYGIASAGSAYRDVGSTLEMLEQNVNPRLALEGLVLGWDKSQAA